MKHYELVCVIDASLSSSEVDELKKKIESIVPKPKDKDEIGLLPLAYSSKGQDQAYFLSYYIEVEGSKLNEMRKELGLLKGVSKFFFYAMKQNEKFMKFSELQKKYEDLVAEEEKKREERQKEYAVESSGEEGRKDAVYNENDAEGE